MTEISREREMEDCEILFLQHARCNNCLGWKGFLGDMRRFVMMHLIEVQFLSSTREKCVLDWRVWAAIRFFREEARNGEET